MTISSWGLTMFKIFCAAVIGLVSTQSLAATIVKKTFVLKPSSLNYIYISAGRNQIQEMVFGAYATGEWCTNTYTMPGESMRCEGPDSLYNAWECVNDICGEFFGGAHPLLEKPKVVFGLESSRIRAASFDSYKWWDSPGVWYHYFYDPTKFYINLTLKDGVDPSAVNVDLQFVRSLPAVPEPELWISMIFGFLSIGAVLRRRSKPALI
jgi:hypothetical protein